MLLGTAMAADRIVRCNPTALLHEDEYSDTSIYSGDLNQHGAPWLFDPVEEHPLRLSKNPLYKKKEKSPYLAVGLSVLLPGAGRSYAGRPYDGFLGLINFFLFANAAYISYENGHDIRTVIFSIGAAAFYTGELYGAYRSSYIKFPVEAQYQP